MTAETFNPPASFWGEGDPWRLGAECALRGGKLLDNDQPEGLFSWRRWRRGFIAAYKHLHGEMP